MHRRHVQRLYNQMFSIASKSKRCVDLFGRWRALKTTLMSSTRLSNCTATTEHSETKFCLLPSLAPWGSVCCVVRTPVLRSVDLPLSAPPALLFFFFRPQNIFIFSALRAQSNFLVDHLILFPSFFSSVRYRRKDSGQLFGTVRSSQQ